MQYHVAGRNVDRLKTGDFIVSS